MAKKFGILQTCLSVFSSRSMYISVEVQLRDMLLLRSWQGWNHRNLRTRRIMHLCMQDDQIGLAPADMARLPLLINRKKFLVNLVRQLGLHLLWTCLAKGTREMVHFWLDIVLLVSTAETRSPFSAEFNQSWTRWINDELGWQPSTRYVDNERCLSW
jgi:hypothetical protein